MATVDFNRINALAQKAKAGSANASDQLMELAYPWVDYIIRDKGWFPPRGMDRDDMIQEGVIGAFQALDDWDPGVTPFVAFGRIAVERWLISQFISAGRLKRKAMNESVSLNEPIGRDKHGALDTDAAERIDTWDLPDSSGLGVDPAEVVAESEPSPLMDAIYRGMSGLERAAFDRCILHEQTYDEAAAAENTDTKSIDNALQRVKRKLAARAPELAADERLGDGARQMLAGLRPSERKKLTDEELRATLPVELLRPSSLVRFQSEHRAWTVPPDRLLLVYPNIHQYAASPEKQAVLGYYLERCQWNAISERTGLTVNACKHHLRRMCEKAAKATGIHIPRQTPSTPLLQRVEQLWTKGMPIEEIKQMLSSVATPDEIRRTIGILYQRKARRGLQTVPDHVNMRRIPLVRLNRIPALLRKAGPMLIPEYLQTLKLYMQGYSQPEIAELRGVASTCIGKNDLPVIRRIVRKVAGFEWLYDAATRERQARLTAIEALGLTPETALQQIPVHHREAFRLYLDGLSHREIDTRAALAPGAAEKLLHYCRSCLRRPEQNKKNPRRHNTPERDAARRIRANPDLYRRYQAYGPALDPERRKLLGAHFSGISTGAIAEMFGFPANGTVRSRLWARIKRAGDILLELEAQHLPSCTERLAKEA